MPFRGVQQPGLGYSVARGTRPKKPKNPSTVGFSQSLWAFVQRCWNGDKQRRPKAAEVVKCLEGAAPKWRGSALKPPSSAFNLPQHRTLKTQPSVGITH